ncbi:uncharacterized protein BX663DRAFT_501744 [Cokeromyces recurvatus]|uniref:uncharacterized protein n=1 Tax=Cokeromyces recurvatus TaxID=90255 RepID=UPI00221E7355|nr:uncharacterized protein BX663DRAFT_501744 [Cokeromyces recurvatus]KAI7905106.1 hypothetical protein BX663DRAFT_501744 [Cokeromyces recurvatus]
MGNQDYYSILGVSKNATDTEIKKAYHKQALKFHPDRNKDKLAKCQFQQISEAFEVLSNKRKYCPYDEDSRTTCSFNNHDDTSLSPEELFAHLFSDTAAASYSSSSSSSDEDDFYDLFDQVCDPPYHYQQKPQSVKRSLPISLSDLYTGTTKRLKVTRQLLNKTTTNKILSVHIQPGSKQGTKLYFPGEGDALPSGQNQDIEFEIQEKPHEIFTRKGDHLYTTLQISLLEALTGFEKSIPKLDGSSYLIKIQNRIIQTGQKEIIHGEGMPNMLTGKKGDMIVQFQVQFPETLTEEQCRTLKSVFTS